MKNFRKKVINDSSGFTLTELIVSATISLIVLISGYALSRIAIESNKKDESSLNLSSVVDNGLNFILDEVRSGKSLVTSSNQLQKGCKNYSGEFLFGIKLPNQAVSKSKYSSDTRSWQAIDCPIIYSLAAKTNSKPGLPITYNLLRKGPEIDEKGFYQARTTINTLADSIDSKMIDQLNCTNNWSKKVIKGITLCFDPNQKAVEIAVSAKNSITPVKDVDLRKTSAAFTRMVDADIMGNVYNIGDGKNQACKSTCDCNMMGVSIVKKKLFFSIDKSGSMGWINIQGKTAMEHAKNELIDILNCLKEDVEFQVVAFNHSQSYAFQGGSQKVNAATRRKAIDFVSKLYAGGGTRPWQGLDAAMQNEKVEQVVLLSDGWTNTSGYCFHTRRYERYSDCYQKFNNDVRDNPNQSKFQDKVIIDTLSIGNNFCSGSGWLGDLSAKNNGDCHLIQ